MNAARSEKLGVGSPDHVLRLEASGRQGDHPLQIPDQQVTGKRAPQRSQRLLICRNNTLDAVKPHAPDACERAAHDGALCLAR